jgi:hypothetical protein
LRGFYAPEGITGLKHPALLGLRETRGTQRLNHHHCVRTDYPPR